MSTINENTMRSIIERIKNRREFLNLSFQDLANLTGMSKSTLQRYETGAIKNLPLSKLDTFAKALQTTSSYLMGWDKNKPAENDELIIELFKQLNEDDKQMILNLARKFSNHNE
jgi:transcriptional regulator with XRE-family HTH domain